MEGTLFIYHPERRLVAFQSGKSTKALVFIAGLTDGFLGLPYLTELHTLLSQHGIALVQCRFCYQVLIIISFLSPSLPFTPFFLLLRCTKYGTSSLTQDAEEIDCLVSHLVQQRGFNTVFLLGHSTGCQDIVRYLAIGKAKEHVKAVILQAPVSDREYMATKPSTAQYLRVAQQLISEGRGESLMDRDAYEVPITASRFYGLAGYLGDDDMFSSDIPAEKRRELFKHITVPSLWVFSGADQFVPFTVDVGELSESIHNSVEKSEVLILNGDKHEVTIHVPEFVSSVIGFLNKFS